MTVILNSSLSIEFFLLLSVGIEQQFLWIYSDRDQKQECLPYPLSKSYSNEFHFYGINEDVVEKFNGDQEEAANGAKKKKNRRDQIEVPAVAIRHKDDPSITIFCGQGVQITKTNFGERCFFIVAILWSSTFNFTFLLVEKDQFYDLEMDAVDKISQGILLILYEFSVERLERILFWQLRPCSKSGKQIWWLSCCLVAQLNKTTILHMWSLGRQRSGVFRTVKLKEFAFFKNGGSLIMTMV